MIASNSSVYNPTLHIFPY